jgi:hypothetical protein
MSIVGDVATCSISNLGDAGHIFDIKHLSTVYHVGGFTLRTSAGRGNAFNVFCSSLRFGNIDFGEGFEFHIRGELADILAVGPYSISGGASSHAASVQARLRLHRQTVTLVGSPAFRYFFNVQQLGYLRTIGAQYVGDATGSKFWANLNSVIETGNEGRDLPGDQPGRKSNGGVVV